MHQLSTHLDGKLNLSSGATQQFSLVIDVWVCLFVFFICFPSVFLTFWTAFYRMVKRLVFLFSLCTLPMKKIMDSFGENHRII